MSGKFHAFHLFSTFPLLSFFKLAWLNVTHRKTRSWLTMVGIFMGIAAVVSLVSLSVGLKYSIQEQFASIGADKLFIQPKGVGFLGPGGTTAVSLTTHDLDFIRKVNGVKLAAANRMRVATIAFNKQEIISFVIDYPKDDSSVVIDEVYKFPFSQGRFLRQNGLFEAVIGNDFATQKVFGKNIKLGDKTKINSVEFRIVGILDKVGDPGTDRSFFIPERGFEQLFLAENVTLIIVKTDKDKDPVVVADSIAKELRRERNVKSGEEDFEVQSPTDILQSFNAILTVIQVVLIGVAAISLLVGGIGIMNTMYTSVLERTKEIGIMKSVGAKNNHILTLFLIESGLLGLVGGIIGVIFGMLLSKLVEFIAAQYLGTHLLKAYFSWELIFASLAFAFIIGALSGTLPARQAMNVKPITALRYD